MSEQPGIKEQEFFEERAKAIEVHTNSNPKLVQAILEGRKETQETMVPARRLFENIDAGNL